MLGAISIINITLNSKPAALFSIHDLGILATSFRWANSQASFMHVLAVILWYLLSRSLTHDASIYPSSVVNIKFGNLHLLYSNNFLSSLESCIGNAACWASFLMNDLPCSTSLAASGRLAVLAPLPVILLYVPPVFNLKLIYSVSKLCPLKVRFESVTQLSQFRMTQLSLIYRIVRVGSVT